MNLTAAPLGWPPGNPSFVEYLFIFHTIYFSTWIYGISIYISYYLLFYLDFLQAFQVHKVQIKEIILCTVSSCVRSVTIVPGVQIKTLGSSLTFLTLIHIPSTPNPFCLYFSLLAFFQPYFQDPCPRQENISHNSLITGFPCCPTIASHIITEFLSY